MRTIQRIVGIAFSVVVATLFAASAAVAAPQTEEFILDCPGGDVAIVTPPGGGGYTPGFIVGTHELFIPYSFTFTLTDAEGNVIESNTQAKAAPVPADAVTCSLSETFTEDGETFTFSLVVTAVIRGQ